MKIQPQDKLLIQLQVIEPLLDSIISEFDEEVPPPLTEERRRDLVKQAKSETEDAKIGIRNARKEANTEIKKLEKE